MIEVLKMKILLLLIILVSAPGFFVHWSRNCDSPAPKRLVRIQGKAMIVNFRGGALPATSETLIFKKVGCDSCFVGAKVENDGKYQILVADGKYEIIVRNPSSPEVDWLAPDQRRIVATDSDNSLSSIIDFDIRIKMPN